MTSAVMLNSFQHLLLDNSDTCNKLKRPDPETSSDSHARVPPYISLMKDGETKGVFLFSASQNQLSDKGFAVIENVFSGSEVDSIIETINDADTSKPTFRKSNELFAIRQFLKEVPEVIPLIF